MTAWAAASASSCHDVVTTSEEGPHSRRWELLELEQHALSEPGTHLVEVVLRLIEEGAADLSHALRCPFPLVAIALSDLTQVVAAGERGPDLTQQLLHVRRYFVGVDEGKQLVENRHDVSGAPTAGDRVLEHSRD